MKHIIPKRDLTPFIPVLLLCTIMHAPVHGHEGDDSHDHHADAGDREWHLQDSADSFTGQFVSATDSRVLIRRSDGWVRPVDIRKLSVADQAWVQERQEWVRRINLPGPYRTVLPTQENTAGSRTVSRQSIELLQTSFQPFESTVKTRSDSDFFYVESTGVPDHPMMVGITAWQQQVPIPQKYTGANAWRIPLKPVPAKNPMSAKDNFFRGAIAIAVNGVPIFNPIKNDGRTDTLLAGELDEFGGHCGRADDYHYHIAPVHLQKVTGNQQPIAWALDGYPIYGYQDEKSPDYAPLDALNGHRGPDGAYHYHATKQYPYLNGGFFGEVVERDGQVDPQPRAESPRPALPPLRGAKITAFRETATGSYELTYQINGKPGTVKYTIAENGTLSMTFQSPDGTRTSEEYTARPRGGRPGGGGGPQNERPPGGNPPPRDGKRPPGDGPRPPREGQGPPRGGQRPPREGQASPQENQGTSRGGRGSAGNKAPQAGVTSGRPAIGNMELTSTSIGKDGLLTVDCTCDGKSQSPAIAWKKLPEGTKSIAVSLWHTAPDQEKSYWVVYNVPATVTELAQNVRGIGKVGWNDRRKAEYDPMCSRGPGRKTYHITVFALSKELTLPPQEATRAGLLKAIEGSVLAETTLDFDYERQ
jgi:Raf kinase inhibitor-like YbhB/YbcL family protein